MSGNTEAGYYSLRLVVDEGFPQQAEDRTVIWIDPELMNGWPQTIPDNGSGPFISASQLIADLNNDAANELFAISYRGQAYLWNFDGSVASGWPKIMGIGNQQGIDGSPAVANIDGGDDIELIVATGPFFTAQVNVWKHDGSDVPGWPQIVGPMYYFTPGGAVPGDIDGDGDMEIICGTNDHFQEDPTLVHAWHHDATPVDGWPLEFPAGMLVDSPVSLADFDNDGDLDVVIQFWKPDGPEETTVAIVDEKGVSLPGWPQVRQGGGVSGITIGDVDGDGDLELFFGTGTGNLVNALDHLGNDLPNWPPPGHGCSVFSTPALGDVDGDGDLEIAFQDLCSNVYLYDRNGAILPGWPQDISNHLVIGPRYFSSVSLGDVDGDEIPDLVVGSQGSARLFAFDIGGNVLPGFPKLLGDDGVAQVRATPSITDFDGDGTVDVAVSGRDGKVYVWDLASPLKASTLEWPRFRNQLQRHARYDPPKCTGDLDEDGDVDGADFEHFLIGFGTTAGDANYHPAVDYNNDGVINADDLGVFAQDLGRVNCPVSLP
jgi:hypothetical protein